VLTFPKGPHIRVVRVVDLGTRRGPAPEAQGLYDDLESPQPRKKTDPRPVKAAQRDAGSGRPTKRERRETDFLKGRR
jgi:ribosome-associated heat shock protein Hsp15